MLRPKRISFLASCTQNPLVFARRFACFKKIEKLPFGVGVAFFPTQVGVTISGRFPSIT